MSEVIVPLAHVFIRPEEGDDQGWQDRALCAQTDPEA
ncbi:MAG TPA: WhiB family transcriptional regulator, partial [Trebonia sp.]|nr:WhiB family transcriptional regulator [Trebonia sp.]